jgi:hypothetical protein
VCFAEVPDVPNAAGGSVVGGRAARTIQANTVVLRTWIQTDKIGRAPPGLRGVAVPSPDALPEGIRPGARVDLLWASRVERDLEVGAVSEDGVLLFVPSEFAGALAGALSAAADFQLALRQPAPTIAPCAASFPWKVEEDRRTLPRDHWDAL